MNNLIKCEFKKLFFRNEFYITLLIGAIIAVIALLEITTDVLFLSDIHQAPIHIALTGENSTKNLILCILPLLATFPCATFYYEEFQNNTTPVIISRTTHSSYFISKYIVISIVAFIVTVFPFILNLILVHIAYPTPEYGVFSRAIYDGHTNWFIERMFLPTLFMNTPLLYALVIIALLGLYGTGMALLSYTLSFIVKKNIVVAITATTVINLFFLFAFATLGEQRFQILTFFSTNYMSSNNNYLILILNFFILFAVSGGLMVWKIIKNRDVII